MIEFIMKIFLFFFIYITYISIISANDLKKMAFDGDPVSMCRYAQELNGDEKNKFSKHSYLLGNISCSKAADHNEFENSHYLVIIEDTEKTVKEIKAEANNNPNKQFLLWALYANGYDVSKLTAFTWLKVAAENKHPAALMVLGTLYFFGYIVPEDRVRGFKLIQKSADLQYPLAKELFEQLNI